MTDIHCEIYGQGQPLVLIHGWSMHSGMWREFAQALADDFQVICLDLPGHGFSQSCQPYDLTTVTDSLIASIDASSFAVLGWSLGALVAIDMASRYPKRVRQLITLAGNPCFVQQNDWPGVQPEVLALFAKNLQHSSQQTLMRFLALQVNGMEHSRGLLKQLKTAVLDAPVPELSVLQAGLGILQYSDLRNQFTNLNQPVLGLFGEKDHLIPVDCAASLKNLNDNAETRVFEKAGHMPFLCHQQSLVDSIKQFCHE